MRRRPVSMVARAFAWRRRKGVSGPGDAWGYEAKHGGYVAQAWLQAPGCWAVSIVADCEERWDRPQAFITGLPTLVEAKEEGATWMVRFSAQERARRRRRRKAC